jgi:hypothetical protein
MNSQADPGNPRFWYKAEHYVNDYRPQFVQRMEPYTAPVWIVDRIGEDMVNIDEHRRNHYEVSHLPAFSKEQARQYCRDQKMQGQMKHPIFTLRPERLKLAAVASCQRSRLPKGLG